MRATRQWKLEAIDNVRRIGIGTCRVMCTFVEQPWPLRFWLQSALVSLSCQCSSHMSFYIPLLVHGNFLSCFLETYTDNMDLMVGDLHVYICSAGNKFWMSSTCIWDETCLEVGLQVSGWTLLIPYLLISKKVRELVHMTILNFYFPKLLSMSWWERVITLFRSIT